ncbi:MAG: hypothetical protein MJB14_06035, partial [Spirochaetes bacterium]|nr:hypothetical protein [Spirochaetota bacterium]
MKSKKILMILFCLVVVFALQAKTIVLSIVSFNDNTHKYYHELLEKALEANGHKVRLKVLRDIPQTRIIKMLETGEIDIHWFVQNPDRDKMYVPVEVGLTNALIGHRVLFIPKGSQEIYNNVKTLNDFRALNKAGGFGTKWYDVKVWEANNLKVYKKDGNWSALYEMVARGGRGVD